jgi:hypothetical protein
MTSDNLHLTWILAILVLPLPSRAAEPLRHNLFARPTLAALAAAPADAAPVNVPTAAWNPRLTAVMVAGPASLANIDGTLLRIGEEVDGYRLLSVAEGEAVLYKNGQRYVLTMAPPGPSVVKNRGGE